MTRFTKDHEWIRLEAQGAVIGITAYAAKQLGDVVFVDLPAVGARFAAGAPMAVVESVKAASDVYAPVAGTVAAVNEALRDAPQTVNDDPQGAGWFAVLHLADPQALDGLMDQSAYDALIAGL